MNLIIILSVFICLASVTAQDSSDTNLTIDESSQTDISQITIDDNDYKTESVENSESSANEQNSSKNLQNSVSVSKSGDKLGVSNYDNVLGASGPYTHDYSNFNYCSVNGVSHKNEIENMLSFFRDFTYNENSNSNNDKAYWTGIYPNGNLYLIIDSDHNEKINWIRLDGNELTFDEYHNAKKNPNPTINDDVIQYTITNSNVILVVIHLSDSASGTLVINPDHSHITISNFKAYYLTEITSLTVNDKQSDKIDLGEDATLEAIVNVYKSNTATELGSGDGKVYYYVKKPGSSSFVKIDDESVPGGSINYHPDQAGDYVFYAVYQENPDKGYFKSTSDYVYLTVVKKEGSKVDVSDDKIVYGNPAEVTVTLVNSTGIDKDKFTITDSKGNTVPEDQYEITGSDNEYTIKVYNLNAGTYTVSVTNTVNSEMYKPSSGEGTITVSKATSSIDVDNQTITYGGTVDITAVIVNSTGVSGATLYKDGQPYTAVTPTISGDKITITNLPRGEYTLNATTAGDANHNSSWDTCKIIVNPAGSEVVVPSKTIVFDASAVLDITGENTTGVSKVEIYKDGQKVEVTPSITGKKVTISGLEVGNYTVRVTNNVDDNHIQNNGEGKITVLPAQSSVKVTGDEITYGETATVSVKFENATSGTYEIVKDGKVIKSGTVTDKIDVSDLAYGEYTVRVNSTVDKNHKVSSGEGTIKVNKANPELTIDATDSKYPENSTITVTSKVDGTYTVDINGTPVTVVVKDGKGNASVKKVPEKYNATVSFEGNENYTSASAWDPFTVSRGDIKLEGNATKSTIYHGETTTLVAWVNVTDATGTITFYDYFEGHSVGAMPEIISVFDLSKGDVVSGLHTGDHVINASYSGDSNYLPKWVLIEVHVKRIVDDHFQVTATPDNYTYGGKTFLKGTVDATDATGNVSYYDQNGRFLGNSTINDGIWVDTLDVATHRIKAVYSGDENYNPSEDNCLVRVAPANSTVKASDVEINHGQKADINIKAENATDVTYEVLKDGKTVKQGTATPSQDDYNIVVEGLEPGEYTLKLTTTVDKNHTSSTNESKITVKPVVNLTITKVVEGETTVLVGDEITYTITVTNKGPSTATNVVVTDLLSGPASIVSEKCDVPEGSVLNSNVWTIASIAADGHATLKLVVLTNARGNVSNSVAVSCDENKTQKTNGTDNVTVVSVIININKTSDIDYIAHTNAQGDKYSFVNNINYTIVVSNVGMDNANNVSVVDVLPSYLSLSNAGFISKSGVNVIVEKDNRNNVVRWNISNLDNETKVVLWVQTLLNTMLPVGTNITNGVEATCKENSTKVSNESNNITIVPVKIEITKTANATVVGNNTLVNFTIVVKNKSLINITDVGIFDLLPKGFTYVNASSFSRYERGRTYNYAPTLDHVGGNTVIRWTDGGKGITELEKDGNVTLWVLARSNGIGPQVNTVMSTCGENHTAGSNRPYYTGTCTVNITSVNLTVTKTADVTNISYSAYDDENANKINYTIIVDNPSLINATDVIVEDRLPAGLTLVNAGYVPVSGVNVDVMATDSMIKLVISKLPNQTKFKLWIQAEISKDTPLGNISNEVTVTCNENATGTSNKTNVTVLPTNLTIVKEVVGKTTVSVGEEIIYTITVTNNGVGIVSNVVVTDVLSGPADITVDKCTVPQGTTFNGKVWSIEKIDAGENIALTVVAVPYLDGTVKNNVSVVCDENKTEKTNESKPVTVNPVVDLEITKKVDKTEVQVGQNITYTIEVVNKGPSRATNVTVTESLSGLVKVVDFGDAKYDVKTNVWSVGDLDKNAHAVLTLVVEVIDNGTVENFVSVKSNETDTNKTNNNDTSDNVTAEPVVDLVITKKVDKTEVQVGDEITFTITVKNNGPSKATDVKVTEELSDLVNLTQAVKGYDGKVWTVGDLAKGESKELVLVVKVIGNGTISNNVTVTSKEEDTNKTNNNDTSDNVTAEPVVDLEITKTIKGNITSVLVGDEITYVISVKNNGPSNATDVKVSEKLSKLVKLIRDVKGYDGNVWTVGGLAKGETKELTLVVKVIGNGTISNNVTVTSKENDTNKSNNNASSPDVEAKPLVILNITKVADVKTANVGENITYTITVTNNGLSNATGVKVTENLSPLVKVVDFGDAKYDKSSNVWTVGDLAVNKTATLRLVVEIIDNGTVENSASVTSKENDTVKNVTSDNVTAEPVVDLEITKKVDRTVANVGENITYTITVTNKGPSKATGVKVNESLSDLVKVVDFGDAKYDKSTNVWDVGDLDVNATATLELVVVIINNGTVENSVFVKSAENDTNMSNNNATSDNVTAHPVVDLEISKSVDKTTANVGETLTYTIKVTNNGPSKATGVKVTEKLSDLVELTSDIDGYKDGIWTVGDLDVNETKELVLVVKVIGNGTVENFVSVSSNENDTNKSNNNDTSDNVTAHPVVDLEITKVVDKTTVNVGETLTYTITVKNNGPSKATGVKVTEELSDLVELAGDIDGYDGKVWTVGDLDVNETKELVLVVKVIANGTVANMVNVSASENDTNKSNNNDTSDNVTAHPVVDLEITKLVDKTTVNVGETLTYTITVKNNGPSKATGVKVAEELSDLVELAGDVDGYDGKVWTVGDLDVNETKELVLVVKVIANGTVANMVNVSASENDTNKSNNNDTSDNVTAHPVVDLVINKTVDKTVVNVGETLTYTIKVTNNGPSKATGVEVTEELSGLVELTEDVDGYDGKVWTVGDLDVNETKELVLVVKVIDNGTVENFVSVSSNENDTNKSNNNDTSDNVTAHPVVDLEISKTVDKTVANVGETLTYTITVKNNGPSKATGVKVTEELSGLVELTGDVDGYDGKVWTVGDLDVNETKELVLVVKIIDNGTVENSVFVKSAENDTNMSNNNATSDNVTAHPVVDLEISKSADKTTANVGDEITYTITVKNNGPSKATGVKVTEELSNLVELTEDVDGYDGKVWTVGDLDVNETKELVLVVKIIANGTVANTVNVSASENDTNKSNNNDTADNVTAHPVVDLEITKVVDKTTANVGDTLTYTIVVKNNGPSKATGIIVTENIDLSLVKVIDSSRDYDNKNNVWSIDSIDAGNNVTLTLTVEVIANGTVKNSVTVKSTENDTDMTNNNASSNDTDAKPLVDLEITKTVDKTTANVGDTLTYTIVVKNNGPSKATDVKVAEKLSDLVELTENVDGYDGKVWTVGEIEAGMNATLTLTVKVIGNGTIMNNVSVSSKENDSDKNNNNDTSDNVTACPVVDLEITKVVDKTTANVGDTLTYTIVVKNNGPSDATDVKVTENIDLGLVKVISASGNYDSETNVWSVDSISSGENATFTLTVEIIANGTVKNSVSVKSTENDTDMTNNNASSNDTEAKPVVDLEITKTVNVTSALVGDEIAYAIVVKNNGPSKATDIKVSEKLSGLVELVSAVSDAGKFENNVWSIDSLESGENATLTLTVRLIKDGIVENSVSVTSKENDSDMSNNNATSDNVTSIPNADLSIIKTVNTTSAKIGQSIEYTIVVKNNGPSDATNVSVDEKLSELVEFVSADGDYDSKTGLWNVGTLENGATATLTLTVKLIRDGTVENNVTVNANEKDTNETNNNYTSDNVTARPVVNLIANVTVNETTPTYGDVIEFVISITNDGPSNATNVTVENAIPEGLENATVVVSHGSFDETTGQWNVGTVNVGDNPTLTIIGTVKTLEPFDDHVEITHFEERDEELEDNNATSEEVKPQPIVDVEISIKVDRSEVNYGDVVEFVITVHNNGPNDARGVYVENVIPQGFVYVYDNISNSNYQKDKLMASASTPSFDASTATWYVGDLANASSASLALLLRANYLGIKDVNSTVSAAESESDYTNNNASASVKVNPVVDLEVKVSVDKTKIKSGEKVTYTIVVINHGPNDATGVKVTDEGLTKLTHVSSTSDAYDHETGVWEVGNLTNGSSKTLKVTVIIEKAGVYPNSAGVSSNENDTDMTNNNATSDDVNVTDEKPADEPVKEKNTTHVAKAQVIKTPVLHETGNPIMMLLLVLVTSIIIPLRRRK